MTLQANARNLLEDKMPGHMFVETLQLITFSSVSQKLKGGGGVKITVWEGHLWGHVIIH